MNNLIQSGDIGDIQSGVTDVRFCALEVWGDGLPVGGREMNACHFMIGCRHPSCIFRECVLQ